PAGGAAVSAPGPFGGGGRRRPRRDRGGSAGTVGGAGGDQEERGIRAVTHSWRASRGARQLWSSLDTRPASCLSSAAVNCLEPVRPSACLTLLPARRAGR